MDLRTVIPTKCRAPMSNAERQQKWRDRHKARKPAVLFGPPGASGMTIQQIGPLSPAPQLAGQPAANSIAA
ncbi:MAG TPA: hypothetical protein VL282_17360 [Tepidisphaeraceae bacterium]|nr:hypothetical protein [Tepidisphaeraceae bacterium]